MQMVDSYFSDPIDASLMSKASQSLNSDQILQSSSTDTFDAGDTLTMLTSESYSNTRLDAEYLDSYLQVKQDQDQIEPSGFDPLLEYYDGNNRISSDRESRATSLLLNNDPPERLMLNLGKTDEAYRKLISESDALLKRPEDHLQNQKPLLKKPKTSKALQLRTSSLVNSPAIARHPSGGKRCQSPGCEKRAQSNGRCKAHGGGARCQYEGCNKSSQGGGLCRSHGGGKRCKVDGCEKGTQRDGLCFLHGGVRHCKVEGCTKKDRGTGYCIAHGGGKRCCVHGCSRAVRKNNRCRQHAAENEAFDLKGRQHFNTNK